ncbi:hypothetical protein [Streptomyces sp. NBC_00503]|uniref:hypothetical protein n=1 Tax=Streptomyces sp. NBC_00503 TaxID=2903659 RepID=UPI002E81CF39|nr:hypothetical protein [Streptomyces sp. NBC_00503]WUD82211.1 hypothetical protein OG490_17640 [Streptomyces sp. NBC_00503]
MFRARARGARGWRLLLGAVLAVLLACAAPATQASQAQAAPARAASAQAGPAHAVPVQPASAHAVPAQAGPAAVPAAAVVFGAAEVVGRGPACAPGAPERGPLPAAPPRGAGDQGHVPPARVGAERAWDGRAIPLRVLVRGPERPAPSAPELSVMRV